MSRNSKHYSNIDKNPASVPKRIREKKRVEEIMKAINGDVLKGLKNLMSDGFKLPDQNILLQVSDTDRKNGYRVVAYSQKHQNESDKLQHELSADYVEDRYIITHNDKSYEVTGTFDGIVNKYEGTLKEYKEAYPDTIILGIGKLEEEPVFIE